MEEESQPTEELLRSRSGSHHRSNRQPLLVNFYAPEGLRIWYRFVFDGDDLCPLSCALEDIGVAPSWWDGDIDCIFGLIGTLAWARWALEEGIAPGQPFLMAIDPPDGHRDYWGEYDEEWSVELVGVVPISPDAAAKRWAQFLRKFQVTQALEDRALEELRVLQKKDVASMYIRRTWYYQNGYCEMEPPSALRLTLSTHRSRNGVTRGYGGYDFACGEDPNGKDSVAMENLIKNVVDRVPHLTSEIIRSLPVENS